jgi:hypothetical protein
VLLEAAQRKDVKILNEVISQTYEAFGNNKLGIANSLIFSKRNAIYKETPFFSETFLKPETQMDQLILLQIYGEWGLYEEMLQVFKSFDWNHLSTIQPMILVSIVSSCTKVEEAEVQEQMMDILIPYTFNSPDQDYSAAISTIQAYFFLRTKMGDEERNKPEYKRIYDKYVSDQL